MKTIQTVYNHVDAQLLKIRLEGEGITCVLTRRPLIEVEIHGTYRPHAIDINVLVQDAQRATDILKPNRKMVCTEHNSCHCCPNCSSTAVRSAVDTNNNVRSLLLNLYALATMVPGSLSPVKLCCESCGHIFEQAER